MRSMVPIANGGRPPLALRASVCGVISDTNSGHGTDSFITSKNSRLRLGSKLVAGGVQAHLFHGFNHARHVVSGRFCGASHYDPAIQGVALSGVENAKLAPGYQAPIVIGANYSRLISG